MAPEDAKATVPMISIGKKMVECSSMCYLHILHNIAYLSIYLKNEKFAVK